MKVGLAVGFLVHLAILLAWDGTWGASLTWQDDWNRTVKAGKEEGRVAVIGPVGADRRDALALPFQKKYGISVDYWPGTGRNITPRITTERGARQYLWDVVIAGALEILLLPLNVLEPLEPALILPEVKETRYWRGGDMEFLDSKRSIFVMSPFHRGTLFVNPKLADAKSFRSYKDLLDPQWKGKIVIDEPRKPGPGQATFLFFYLHPDLGPDFIRALAGQDLVILRDYAQEVDAVAGGKYPVGIGFSDSIAEQRMRQGVPIAIVDPRDLREGSDVSPASGQLGLFDNTPHPNAAKVYVNWLLSREGQTEFTRATGYISNRLDVRTDHAAPWRVPMAGAVKTYGLEARRLGDEGMNPLLNAVLRR